MGDPLSEAVRKAVIAENQGKFLPGECYGVGYRIMEAFDEDDVVSVYALTEYVEYRFEDDVLVNISGTNPRVLMRFRRTDGDDYSLIYYTTLDIFSGLSEEELEVLMEPLERSGRAYLYTDQDLREIRAQADSDAAEYLRAIGRNAEVGSRRDHEGQRLDELVSDRSFVDELSKDNRLNRYPNWTGTTERIENDIRYVYQTDFDAEDQTIVYTKMEYDSGHIVEAIKADVRQGVIIDELPSPRTVSK